jgi:hypothetical protein
MNQLKSGGGLKFRQQLPMEIESTAPDRGAVTVKWSTCFLGVVLPTIS